jgi:hypothetical protein
MSVRLDLGTRLVAVARIALYGPLIKLYNTGGSPNAGLSSLALRGGAVLNQGGTWAEPQVNASMTAARDFIAFGSMWRADVFVGERKCGAGVAHPDPTS